MHRKVVSPSRGTHFWNFFSFLSVPHVAVAEAANWRLMSLNLPHKLFLQIPELPLLPQPTPSS